VRILLDECVPAGLKRLIAGHAVRTVPECGWRSSKDGSLLEFAETQFDVFLTIDRKIESEIKRVLRIAVIIASVSSNRLVDFHPILPDLLEAIDRVRQGEIVRVG
jgi:hypothetical protein